MLNLSRSVYRYQSKPSDDEELREQLLSLASRKPRWGFQKMSAYLKNQGRSWNHKRVRRVYRALELNLRVKPKKRLPVRNPQPLVAPAEANICWSLDFMHDSLVNGRTIRTLNIGLNWKNRMNIRRQDILLRDFSKIRIVLKIFGFIVNLKNLYQVSMQSY